MRKLICLMAVIAACSFAAVKTGPTLSFTDGIPWHGMTRTATRCTTDAFTWGDAPYVSLSWNVYGRVGARYGVGIQWADGTGHFDARVDTILVDTIPAGATTRAAAVRHTQEFARMVSTYGRAIFMRDTLGDTLTGTVYADSSNLVSDER